MERSWDNCLKKLYFYSNFLCSEKTNKYTNQPEKWIKLLPELLSGEQLRQFFDSAKQKNEKK
jgi:hypothetical protein